MAESSEIGNVIGFVARKVGVAEPVLRLTISLLTGLPLAFVYRTFCYRKNATVQHVCVTVCGVGMAFFCFGWSCLHSVVNIVVAYLLLQLGGPQAVTVILMFVLNVGYLITGYALKSYCQDYSVSWTTAHCVLCLRLTGLAWDYYDGNQDQEKLSEDFKRTAIRECPSLLQVASYTYFFGGFLVGPQFPIKKYLALIEGNLIDKKDDASISRIIAGLQRFSLGLIYLTVYTVLQPKVKDSFLITDEYDNDGPLHWLTGLPAAPLPRYMLELLIPLVLKSGIHCGTFIGDTIGTRSDPLTDRGVPLIEQKSFLYKLCYAIATTKVSVMKYQAVWLIAEGSCIISGLGYNGRSDDGKVRWDGCSNVHLLLFETAYTFQHVIDAFNLNTNQWMFRYLYKRLRFLGSKVISHFITLFFVALWHGIAPGFFLCFIGEFVIIVMEQQLLGLCRRVVQKPFTALPLFVKIPIILLGVCVRLTGVAFFLIPFFLRRLDYTHKAWLSLYYVGPIVLSCWFILYPTIIMPIARSLMRKPRTNVSDSNQNKFKEPTKQE